MIEAALEGTAEDPQAILRQVSILYRQIAERASLGWQLYRDAAASDAEIATDWKALQDLRHQTFATLIHRLPREAFEQVSPVPQQPILRGPSPARTPTTCSSATVATHSTSTSDGSATASPPCFSTPALHRAPLAADHGQRSPRADLTIRGASHTLGPTTSGANPTVTAN